MDAFSYLSVLVSIILGLAITQVLKGLRGAVLARAQVVPYWPTFVFAGFLLMLDVQTWWSSFGLRNVEVWTFPMFAMLLVQTFVLYMLAALVLPDFFGEKKIDLREHYFAHRHLFFGLFLALITVSLLRGSLFRSDMARLEQEFHFLFATGPIAGMLTAREWVHKFFAIAISVAFIVFIALLFSHLPSMDGAH